jgi:hypothetical protein
MANKAMIGWMEVADNVLCGRSCQYVKHHGTTTVNFHFIFQSVNFINTVNMNATPLVKCTVFWDVITCSPVKAQTFQRKKQMASSALLGNDGGCMFLQNHGEHL